MEISDAKRLAKLRGWSEMIGARSASGLTVRTWCQENGISVKTYYYRLKRVRLAALQEQGSADVYLPSREAPSPIFAELDFGSPANHLTSGSCAATVRIGGIAIDINNGADPALISVTLSMARELC